MKILSLVFTIIMVTMTISISAFVESYSSSDFECDVDSHPEIVNGETVCVQNVTGGERNIDENVFIWIGIGFVGIILILLVSKIKMRTAKNEKR